LPVGGVVFEVDINRSRILALHDAPLRGTRRFLIVWQRLRKSTMVPGRRILRRVAMSMAVVVAVLSPLRAAEPDICCPPCNKDRLLSIAAGDSEAIVMVRNASAQRRSSGGRALERMLEEAGPAGNLHDAWRELARTLDWDGDHAFDELLGRHFALVMRGLETAEPQWVVLSEVSMQTERRLRQRLRPAARGSVGGMLSLAIESGRYELVVAPAPVEGAGSAMILLGPGTGNPLVARLAPLLMRPMPAPPPGPGGRECDFLVMLRSADRGDYLLLTGTMEAGGWDAHLAASSGMVWGQPEGMERIEPWSEGDFRHLERDALLAVMGIVGSTRLEGIAGLHALSGLVPAIPLAFEGEPYGPRAAIFLREGSGRRQTTEVTGQAGDAPTMLRAARHRLQGEASPPAQANLTLGLAIETTDAQAMSIEGDRMISRFVASLERGEFEPLQRSAVQLVVAVPQSSMRALRLDGTVPVSAALANGLERAFGPDPMVSWGVRPSGAARHGPGPGWWLAAISPADGPTVEADAAALARENRDRRLPRLSMGLIRPAALQRAVGDIDPGFLAPYRSMRWIDTLRWDAWQRDDGAVEATIRIRMVRPAP
jgi:hypothetical protein